MSAVQRASSTMSASSPGDNGLCESNLPSTASREPYDDLPDAKEMMSRLLEPARAHNAEELRAKRKRGDNACKGLHRKIRVLTARMRQRLQDDQSRLEGAKTKLAEQSGRIFLLERRLAARDDENNALSIRLENLLTPVKETGDMQSAAAKCQG